MLLRTLSTPPRYNTSKPPKTLTLVTAFYVLPMSKFSKETYTAWLSNLLQLVWYNPYVYLVIYTDAQSSIWLPNIIPQLLAIQKVSICVRPMEHFYMYKYADFWRKNHDANTLLRRTTCWELNMLWNEKLWFLRDVIQSPPPEFERTPYYAWCDAGYFRNRSGVDLDTTGGFNYSRWASPSRMAELDSNKIYYSLVNSDISYVRHIKNLVQHESILPPDQVTIGGGFCLIRGDDKEKISDWCVHYENVLINMIEAGRLVKDDQIILANCIFSLLAEKDAVFYLVKESVGTPYDPWFVFQRFLL